MNLELLNGAVQAIRAKQPTVRTRRSINNVEHLPRGTGKHQSVEIGRNDVRHSAQLHPLIIIARSVEDIPKIGDLLRGADGGFAEVEDLRPDIGGMISLGPKYARRGEDQIDVGEQSRAAPIGRDTHVFKDEGAEEEIRFTLERIE